MRYTLPLALLSFCSIASAISIDWATAQSSTGVTNPLDSLGPPNGLNSTVNPGGLLTASQFLQRVTYSNSALAAALNLSSLPLFNVILLEFNGTPGLGWEGSQFSFSSGGPTVTMQVNSGAGVGIPTNFVVAAGAITRTAYQTLFGFAPVGIPAGDIPYLLFDLSSSGVNVASSAFQLSINGFNGSTPDPDAIGIIPPSVPEPGTAILMVSALAILVRIKRGRAPSASNAWTDNQRPESR